MNIIWINYMSVHRSIYAVGRFRRNCVWAAMKLLFNITMVELMWSIRGNVVSKLSGDHESIVFTLSSHSVDPKECILTVSVDPRMHNSLSDYTHVEHTQVAGDSVFLSKNGSHRHCQPRHWLTLSKLTTQHVDRYEPCRPIIILCELILWKLICDTLLVL